MITKARTKKLQTLKQKGSLSTEQRLPFMVKQTFIYGLNLF